VIATELRRSHRGLLLVPDGELMVDELTTEIDAEARGEALLSEVLFKHKELFIFIHDLLFIFVHGGDGVANCNKLLFIALFISELMSRGDR
jgi:hypothetical protein